MASNSADIVFVLDCSSSMEPCIEGVKRHIGDFLEVFEDDPNGMWDVRLELVAHRDATRENRLAGVDRDFRERVESAGGRYDDVDIRATLIWHDRNDLDLHVYTPAGEHIYHSNRQSNCGGELDVDRNVEGETRQPVENIRWASGSAAPGEYRVEVVSYRNHESAYHASPFKIELVNGHEVNHYDLTAPPARASTAVCAFSYPPSSRAQVGKSGFHAESLYSSDLLESLYRRGGQQRFFTKDLGEFRAKLGALSASENECPLLALDCALDLPWRSDPGNRRVVIFLTDEPMEGGNRLEESRSLLPEMINKIQLHRAMLFLVAPDSEGFEELASANRALWHSVDGGDGLQNVDFNDLLLGLARSISKSQSPLGRAREVPRRALFGQGRG